MRDNWYLRWICFGLMYIFLMTVQSCETGATQQGKGSQQSYEKQPYEWMDKGDCHLNNVTKSDDCATCLDSCKKACEKFPRDSDNRATCDGQCLTQKDRCSAWFS